MRPFDGHDHLQRSTGGAGIPVWKAGAQKWAAEEGIALIFPDTSPRGMELPMIRPWIWGRAQGFT